MKFIFWRKRESLTGGLNSRAAKRILQLHRLVIFEQTFSAYLEGKATAEQVRARAAKMLSAGLPERIK